MFGNSHVILAKPASQKIAWDTCERLPKLIISKQKKRNRPGGCRLTGFLHIVVIHFWGVLFLRGL